ncbi:hypothetical protein LTR27_012358 [Elasticomyces elasticus]|nr:hypothetical protein LTR27_012358 [Elasticomyces elasticus]
MAVTRPTTKMRSLDLEEIIATAFDHTAVADASTIEELSATKAVFADLIAQDPFSGGIIGRLYAAHQSLLGFLLECRMITRMVEAGLKLVRGKEGSALDFGLLIGPALWADGLNNRNMDDRLEWLNKQPTQLLLLGDCKTAEEKTTRKHKDENPKSEIRYKITGKQLDNGAISIHAFARQPEMHAVSPAHYTRKVVAKEYTDPLLTFSEIPPPLQPWALHASKLPMMAINLEAAATHDSTDYCNPGTGVRARDWKPPTTTSSEHLQTQVTDNEWVNALIAAKDPPHQLLRASLGQLKGWSVDIMDTQPLVADTLVTRHSDGSKFAVEDKLGLLKERETEIILEMPMRFKRGSLSLQDLIALSPFAETRCWDYLFHTRRQLDFGYLIPRGVVPRDEIKLANSANVDDATLQIVLPKRTLEPFRVLNDNLLSLGRQIEYIITQYPRTELHQFKYTVPEVQAQDPPAPVNVDEPNMWRTWDRTAYWLFEQINDWLAALKYGVFLPFMRLHDEGTGGIYAWVWKGDELERWRTMRRLPTGIGLPSLKGFQPCLRVRLLDGSTRSLYTGHKPCVGKKTRQRGFEDASALHRFPALCIVDMQGILGQTRPTGKPQALYGVPSEFLADVASLKHGYHGLELRRPHKWAQFVMGPNAASETMGKFLMDFFNPLDRTITWSKSKASSRFGSSPAPLRVGLKDVYLTCNDVVLQRQVDDLLSDRMAIGDDENDQE